MANLEKFLLDLDVRNVLLVYGKRSRKALDPFLPSFRKVTARFERYEGECTDTEIGRIAKLSLGTDLILGIGGGKALDVAKGAAHKTGKSVILLPTLAATCSAWTPLSVVYDEAGRYLRFDVYPRQGLATFFEPRAVLSSTTAYLLSGIGDTLAKWYEAEALSRHLPSPPVPVLLGLDAAKRCRDILLERGVRAVRDFEAKSLTEDLTAVLETNIVAGGSVGGFAERFGRIAAAHSIHNGLTRLPETHGKLHGEKVAYGVLVQLLLEGNRAEAGRLADFFRAVGLPRSAKDLGLAGAEPEKLRIVAEGALAPGESIHLMPRKYSAAEVTEALLETEKL